MLKAGSIVELAKVNRRRSTIVACAAALVSFSGCHRTPESSSAPFPQWGYLWQRDWTQSVSGSLSEAGKRLNGVVLLGAEIRWAGDKGSVLKVSIPWSDLRKNKQAYSVALRVDPTARCIATSDPAYKLIVDTAKTLLKDARDNGVALSEFQLDFDCPQKGLGCYREWLTSLHHAVEPTRFVITTLPAWLDEPEFRNLVREVDAYVLQVHSVPTMRETGRAKLCDTALARNWVAKAARFGIPFSVALPTYRCVAGYGSNGKLLGVVMDSIQPVWPPGTRTLEFEADADEIADLVKEWRSGHPSNMTGVFWYRLPLATDQQNWRWSTLAAVMKGERPEHRLVPLAEGENPIDLAVMNNGEAEERLSGGVEATWDKSAKLVSSDALPGWKLQQEANRVVFKPDMSPARRLSPGARSSIGWLRYDQHTTVWLRLVQDGGDPR